MAEGALKNSHAQLSLAITGLAGPQGDDSLNEPVGKVYIGCAITHGLCKVNEYLFSGNRKEVCEQAMIAALKMAIECIQGINT